MATPPVISAPTLVTSTNPLMPGTPSGALSGAPLGTPSSATPSSGQNQDEWHTKYLEAKGNYRKLKSQMREQAKKSRQLIAAVKNKLQEEEDEKNKMRTQFEQELSGLCQQLLSLQASMLREQTRVETLIKEKDQQISKQKQDLDKLSQTSTSTSPSTSPPSTVSVTSLSGLSPVALGGSLRIHGSFRQYKKDREKIRQQLKNSSTTTLISGDISSSSSGININSSEESSSSPSTLPRTQKGTLRPTLSLEDSNNNNVVLTNKKKGILKPSQSDVQEVLTNLDQLIEHPTSKTKIRINQANDNSPPEDKSDSGRESDDIEPIVKQNKSPNVSVVTVSATDSANSSFDGADPTLSWKINVKTTTTEEPVKKAPNKKVKPPPPPRSSQTRLSTIRPKSILSPTSSLNTEMTPTEALDNLIHNNSKLRQSENKKKRVKFNPKIDTSNGDLASAKVADVSQSPNANTPLDPNFLHFLPRLSQKQETAKKSDLMESSGNNRNFSYYEPYI